MRTHQQHADGGLRTPASTTGTSDSGFYADPDSMGGVPHEARERHQVLSPMKHAHKARTPALILQGKDDQRCPIGQAEELFTTLMCQAKAQTEMVLYPARAGDREVMPLRKKWKARMRGAWM